MFALRKLVSPLARLRMLARLFVDLAPSFFESSPDRIEDLPWR
jgi:hypothetical protein